MSTFQIVERQAGVTVISTASSDEKLKRLNYITENFAERTRQLTDGRERI